MRLVLAELTKIRTTSTWWIFGLVMVPLWGLAVLYNWGTTSLTSDIPADAEVPPDQAELLAVVGSDINVATTHYTSGQFLGVLLVMLLGAILVTNEFHHQTATNTFLVTPHRERVVLAKLAAGVLLGLGFWLLTTVLNLLVVPFVLRSLDVPVQLGEPAVWRAIGLNALAYALWAILGVGAGVLIRSQIGATLTLSIGYLIGSIGGSVAFALLTQFVADFFAKLEVIVPTTASQLMVAGTDLPGNPPRWVGAAVLIGYALITGAIGTLIMRRRDIS
ncbi:ABC transporter permease [Actinoplanes sp. NPDC051633]|uniref:ABC transporter permease n=1 Tax=Actinoplanes sp. NPDC051633 TaxID=3155670 RepID=UPI0034376892